MTRHDKTLQPHFPFDVMDPNNPTRRRLIVSATSLNPVTSYRSATFNCVLHLPGP